MGYKPETVASAVQHLNINYFLPAIQREFVWGPEKIEQLFDSLLRGYPISSFLFWSLRPENRDRWQIYRFIEDARQGGSHNSLANTAGVQQLTLVLDGQQRLTSLLVGLRGSYTVKKKWKRKHSANAWTKQRLYMNLLSDPKLADEEQGLRYEFSFSEDQPKDDADHKWFRVGRIMDFQSEDEFSKFQASEEDTLPGDTTKDAVRRFRDNFYRLYRAVWKDESIAVHTEIDQDYDRVLDIFVRANDGGVKLSKSDLLLSMVTSQWGDLNAREQIYNFVDHLNDGQSAKNNLDKDFLMKTCLVLSDLPVRYAVENFNNQNLETIKSHWVGIQDATGNAVRLTNSFGIDRDTLLSANALIPIIQFIFLNPHFKIGGTTDFDMRSRENIRIWLEASLLRNVFSGSGDTILGRARAILKASQGKGPFPISQLNADFAKVGKPCSFDAAAINEIIDLSYGERRTYLALGLLYDDAFWKIEPQIDHVFPQKLFTKKAMTERGVPLDRHEALVEVSNRLGNLQILTETENKEKSGTEFSKWIGSRGKSFYERQLIPMDEALWGISKFEKFVSERERLISARLQSLFNAPRD
jgi:hypothetical protein